MDINYQRSPKTEQYITAKISGNALKQGSSSATAAQFTTAKVQGCVRECLVKWQSIRRYAAGMADTQG